MRALALAGIVTVGAAARAEQAPPPALSGRPPPLRGPPPAEPLRAVMEYAVALASFSALNAGGAGILSWLGMGAADVDRTAARVVDGVLYFAVPLGAVLLQNATRSEKE